MVSAIPRGCNVVKLPPFCILGGSFGIFAAISTGENGGYWGLKEEMV